MLFSLYFLLYLRVIILPLRLFQVHPQVVETFRCRGDVSDAELLPVLLEEVVGPPVFEKVGRRPILIFAGRGLDGKIAPVLSLYEFDVFVLDGDDGGLLVLAEKVVLLLVLHPAEGLHRGVVKVDGAEIRIAVISSLEVSLEKEIVGSADVVVLVGLDAPFGILYVKLELAQFL